MIQKSPISGRQIAAARALTGVSLKSLAVRSRLPEATVRRMEAGGSARVASARHAAAVRGALESFGAVFLDENKHAGAGVRLKFTRSDARQIGRLENEGGVAADDDVP